MGLPGVPVEVVEPGRAAPAVGPGGEVFLAGDEAARREHGDLFLGADEVAGPPGGRVAHLDHLAVLPEPLAVGLGAQVNGLVAQLGGAVADRGEDQVGLLAMERAATEDRL
ncbi:hypothetical protein Psuf_018040 [Phytohabitans suffuscus]|uniref:Uncharacterized protein n=1 Tax=Phytohabitans suffuscus TaxID=624315 RepID=A0A6F8YEW8_9ACTN|nr:hypothetical protein Psuf_018040 [Phytohabitans suffuscus]